MSAYRWQHPPKKEPGIEQYQYWLFLTYTIINF